MRQRETRAGRRGYWMLCLALGAAVALGLGNGLAAANEPAGAPPFDIFTMQADGSQQTRLTFDGQSDQPAWSPDGRIVFSSSRAGGSHLFVMNAEGSHVQQLTFGAANEWSPDWSPDGRRIVFLCDQVDLSNTCVMDVADGG